MKRYQIVNIAVLGMIVLGALLSIDRAQAVEPDNTPQTLVETLHAGLLEIMKAGDNLEFTERMATIEPIVNKTFDMRSLSGKTVGVTIWKEWSDDQKNMYIETFTKFLTASYADKFNSYSGQSFSFVSTEDAPKGLIYVKSHLNRPGKDPVLLNYLIGTREDKKGIVDVFFDNVSEAARRQSEFKGIYLNSGFDALLLMLTTKVDHMAMASMADDTGLVGEGESQIQTPDTSSTN